MGCLSHRRKNVAVSAEQKWDYINLNDFKSKGCFPGFAYGYLWFLLFISIAVYGVDSFTAVNLLAFNRWPSEIEPAIGFDVSKWIFSICIIASFVNLGFEHLRALRVMKRGNIAECYLNDLAVRLESIRLGKGQGFRRFLVFAELTKSKKGAEYIALFTYFSFQSWIRVLLCSGPRQVVNALTLKAVYEARLLDASANSVESSIMGFFRNIGALAQNNYQLALILSGMLFTLVIWVFSILCLLLGVVFYVFFLWHWIPKADGGLSGYCERKANKALLRIVAKKVNKALAKEEESRMKAEYKAAMKGGEKPRLDRQATLPTLPNVEVEDKLPAMPMIHRNETTTTLPAYTSRPGTPGSIELTSMDQKRPMPTRTGTVSSVATYSSRAPLIGGGADMGYGGRASPAPSVPSLDLNNYPPQRPGTSNSQRSFAPRPGPGLNRGPSHATQLSGSSFSTSHGPSSSFSGQHGPSSSFSGQHGPSSSFSGLGPKGPSYSASGYTESPVTYASEMMPPFPPPVRSPTNRTMDSYRGPVRDPMPPRDNYANNGRPMPGDNYANNGRPSPSSRQTFDDYMDGGVTSPVQSVYSNRSGPGPSLPRNPAQNAGPYQPMRSATGPVPPRGPPYPPQRNMTAPVPPRQAAGGDDYYSRPPTAGSQRGPAPNRGPGYGYDVDIESQRDRRY